MRREKQLLFFFFVGRAEIKQGVSQAPPDKIKDETKSYRDNKRA